MEENNENVRVEVKRNNNTGIIVLLVIIILILGVCVGYLLSKNSSDEKTVINDGKQTTSETVIVKETEMSADDRYKAYIAGLKNSLKTVSEYGETFDGERYDAYLFYSGSCLEFGGVENIKLKSNGDLYVELSKDSYLGKKHGTNYKIASNIVRVGVTEDGQDGNGIYMINDEGKLYYCEFHGVEANSSEHSLEFKEITKLKNIVNVENLNNGETMIPFAFDIDGNIYDISKLK